MMYIYILRLLVFFHFLYSTSIYRLSCKRPFVRHKLDAIPTSWECLHIAALDGRICLIQKFVQMPRLTSYGGLSPRLFRVNNVPFSIQLRRQLLEPMSHDQNQYSRNLGSRVIFNINIYIRLNKNKLIKQPKLIHKMFLL